MEAFTLEQTLVCEIVLISQTPSIFLDICVTFILISKNSHLQAHDQMSSDILTSSPFALFIVVHRGNVHSLRPKTSI